MKNIDLSNTLAPKADAGVMPETPKLAGVGSVMPPANAASAAPAATPAAPKAAKEEPVSTVSILEKQKATALETAKGALNRYMRGIGAMPAAGAAGIGSPKTDAAAGKLSDIGDLKPLVTATAQAATPPAPEMPKIEDGGYTYQNTRVTLPKGFDTANQQAVADYMAEQNEVIDWMIDDSNNEEEDF